MIGAKIAITGILLFFVCVFLNGGNKNTTRYFVCALFGVSGLVGALVGVLIIIWG